jgi:hypothetical protein
VAKLDWEKANLRGKPRLDYRREFEVRQQDRASRWLAAVERRMARSNSITSRSSVRPGWRQ